MLIQKKGYKSPFICLLNLTYTVMLTAYADASVMILVLPVLAISAKSLSTKNNA